MEAVRRLLDLRHRGRTEDLPPALLDVAPHLDADELVVLLVDYEQLTLWPLRGTPPDGGAHVVNDSVAGLGVPHRPECSRTRPATALELWLPLLHGAERLGVLKARFKTEPDPRLLDDLQVIAALVAELIASRRFYGDAVERTRRRLPMQLAAEIVWNQLPPLTFAANDTVVTAVLEPCYDVGGDAFDYAANDDVLHVALFDTVGHGIEASALTTLTLNTYRNARRSGLSLADTYRSIDKWIRAQYNGAFVTAVLCRTGHRDRDVPPDLRRSSARAAAARRADDARVPDADRAAAGPRAHAAPAADDHRAAARTRRHARALHRRHHRGPGRHRDAVRPGPAAPTSWSAAQARHSSQPEIMRRLIHTIVSYENGDLRDDATAALLQWRP